MNQGLPALMFRIRFSDYDATLVLKLSLCSIRGTYICSFRIYRSV